jgi:hypothetical protein
MASRLRSGVPPVFVDHRGRRRRAVAIVGAAGAAVLTLAVIMLVAGFAWPGSGHLPGLPGLAPPHHSAADTLSQVPHPTAQVSGSPFAQVAGSTPTPTGTPSLTPTAQNTHRNVPTQTPSHTKRH